jgi:hypothetical protein
MIDTTIIEVLEMDLDCQLVDGEYRINYLDGTELTAFYTSSADTAIEAAKFMHELQKGLA